MGAREATAGTERRPSFDPAAAVGSHRQPTVGQVGTVLFLASDLMLFAALFTAWFVLRSSNPEAWPPPGVELETVPATIFTVLLLASSGTLQMGVRAMETREDLRALRRWTAVTIVLGTLFALNQIREYAVADFGISSHAYGSVYVGLTSVHLAHVVLGLVLLATIWWRAGHDEVLPPGDVHSTGYVWHVVDLVWAGVYTIVFLVP